MIKQFITIVLVFAVTASASLVSLNEGRFLAYLDEQSVVDLLFGDMEQSLDMLEEIKKTTVIYRPKDMLEATYGPYYDSVLADARKNRYLNRKQHPAQDISDAYLNKHVYVAEMERGLPIAGVSLQEYAFIAVTLDDFSTIAEEMRHQMQDLRFPSMDSKYARYVNRFLEGDYYGIDGDYLIATGKEREVKIAGLKAYIINEVTHGYIPTAREYEAIFNMMFNGYRELPRINEYVGEDFVYYIRKQKRELRQTIAYLFSVEAPYLVEAGNNNNFLDIA